MAGCETCDNKGGTSTSKSSVKTGKQSTITVGGKKKVYTLNPQN
jgi:hypothetical protein